MDSVKRVVINASPLITLCRSQLHVLLPQVFDAIYVPDAVWQEVVHGGKDDAAARILPAFDCLTRLPPGEPELDIQRWNLGRGSQPSCTMPASYPQIGLFWMMLLPAAVRVVMNIPMTGMCGIIVLAQKRGILPKAEPAFRQLQAAGLWVSEEVIAALLKAVGE